MILSIYYFEIYAYKMTKAKFLPFIRPDIQQVMVTEVTPEDEVGLEI